MLDLTFLAVYSHIQYCTTVLCRFKVILHGTTWQINRTPTKLCSEYCWYLVALIHCAFFSLFYLKKFCVSFKLMFTMTRQTKSSAHIVLCNIPKEVHVPSLRKQLTLFYDATTGFPAKRHLINDCRNSILWWQVTTQTWEGHFINIEYLQSFLRCYFAGKPVVASQNVYCFLSLTCACCHFFTDAFPEPYSLCITTMYFNINCLLCTIHVFIAGC